MATLVFKTLRVGFPTADVFVYSNGCNSAEASGVIRFEALNVKAAWCQNLNTPLTHGEWIEGLIAAHKEPFLIADSDTVFFDRVEDWYGAGGSLFAGRYEPEFLEPWTKTIHVARLHPSMMWINPVPLRAAIRGWPGKPEFFDSVQKNLIQWNWVPRDGGVQFYDTCAGLHHAFGGHVFTDEQNAAFEHLFCGSYAHMTPLAGELDAVHRAIIADPQAAKGLWAKQQEWYDANKV